MTQAPPPESPPPSAPPPPGATPSGKPPADQIKPPAIALLVIGILSLLFAIYNLITSALSFGGNNQQLEELEQQGQLSGDTAQTIMFFSGTVGVVVAIIGILGAAFVIWGSLKMQKLESFGLAMATAIVAMIPIITPVPCCLLGIGFGIWALVVMNKAEVKAAFHG